MIDFACKRFNIDDIIKCGLGLTKTELKIMYYFITDKTKECTTASAAKKLDLNQTTLQKAVKKLSEKGIIIRRQKNLQNGGYIFTYESNTKENIRKVIKKTIRTWSDKVEKEIDYW